MDKIIDKHPRNGSFCFDTDLLFKKDNIYIMDNHRTAAWCWSNYIDQNEKYTIIHIDKHYDTLGNQIKEWTDNIKDGIKSLSLDEYDNIQYQHSEFDRFKVFRWDNYIPLFHYFHSNQIIEYLFYTHRRGSIPKNLIQHITHCPAFNLFNDFRDCYTDSKDRFIINLDIDYFFCDHPHYYMLFTDYAIENLIEGIMKIVEDKRNILTIALSPECCGGWGNSLDFINKYFAQYNILID